MEITALNNWGILSVSGITICLSLIITNFLRESERTNCLAQTYIDGFRVVNSGGLFVVFCG